MGHFNDGNKHAIKPETQKATSHINARVKRFDKAAWVKQAQREEMKLTAWIVKTLNAACCEDRGCDGGED
jgi:predicted HicB family RNase H-like nuclease